MYVPDAAHLDDETKGRWHDLRYFPTFVPTDIYVIRCARRRPVPLCRTRQPGQCRRRRGACAAEAAHPRTASRVISNTQTGAWLHPSPRTHSCRGRATGASLRRAFAGE